MHCQLQGGHEQVVQAQEIACRSQGPEEAALGKCPGRTDQYPSPRATHLPSQLTQRGHVCRGPRSKQHGLPGRGTPCGHHRDQTRALRHRLPGLLLSAPPLPRIPPTSFPKKEENPVVPAFRGVRKRPRTGTGCPLFLVSQPFPMDKATPRYFPFLPVCSVLWFLHRSSSLHSPLLLAAVRAGPRNEASAGTALPCAAFVSASSHPTPTPAPPAALAPSLRGVARTVPAHSPCTCSSHSSFHSQGEPLDGHSCFQKICCFHKKETTSPRKTPLEVMLTEGRGRLGEGKGLRATDGLLQNSPGDGRYSTGNTVIYTNKRTIC